MRYRVVRDLGNTDFPVGSVFDGAAFDGRRVQRLIEQGRIEPVADPNEQITVLEAKVAALTAENARLAADLVAAQAGTGDQAAAGADGEGTGDAPSDGEAAPDLAKLTVPQLKELAATRGIEGHASLKRAELIAALTVAEGGQDG